MSIHNALFTGKNIIRFDELASTNDYANELIAKINPPEGTCIITDYQSAGRGQIGRYWHSSPAKNLLVSYIFYPTMLHPKNQFYLSIIGALAVRDTVEHWASAIKIKWPNDIYAEDKKVAGILVQNTLRGETIKASVFGIGLNVNEQSFPASIPNPVSMSELAHTLIDREDVLALLSSRLEFYYLQLRANKLSTLLHQYLTNLYKINQWHQFKSIDSVVFKGMIKGIDHDGKLQLLTELGETKYYGFRELTYETGANL
jgi:BirA family biotin operon repressor/biotin-[acetyl-CoA-carboxylase] ligase